MDKRRRFKKDNPTKTPITLLWIGISILALLVLGFVFFSRGEVSNFNTWFSSESIPYFINLIAGFIISVLAAFFWEKAKSKKQENLITYLESIADTSMLNDIIEEIEFYNKRYFKDYSIVANIKSCSKKNFLKLDITYSFKKRLNKSKIEIQFFRVTNEQQRQEAIKRKKNYSYLDMEYYDTFDETDFGEGQFLSDQDYNVEKSEIKIGGEPIKLTKLTIDNVISYEADIPFKLKNNNDLQAIEYTVSFLLEQDSYLNFIFDLPIDGLKCELKYEDVHQEIYIGGSYYVSSSREHPPFDRGEDNSFYINHNGWILPKSSVVFMWWKKKK